MRKFGVGRTLIVELALSVMSLKSKSRDFALFWQLHATGGCVQEDQCLVVK